MKNDTIQDLIRESRLKTSDGFTDELMEALDRQIQQKMNTRLYALIAGAGLLFCIVVYALIISGFRIEAFGLSINLPKVLTMLGITIVGYITISHLITLSRLWNTGNANLT